MAVSVAKALYDFTGEEAGDLSFKLGDTIYILSKDDSGWWVGRNERGEEGEFPYNYVEELKEQNATSKTVSVFVGKVPQGSGADSITSVKVSSLSGHPTFNVEVILKRKTIGGVKKMEDFRKLDELIRCMYPNYDRPLPPAWADNLYESEQAGYKKARVLHLYLTNMLINGGSGNELTECVLATWCSPRESFNASSEIKRQVKDAQQVAARNNGGRNNYDLKQLSKTPLARAEYEWESKDIVELPLQVDILVAVRNKNTLNEGWWEGEDASGQRGLFPNNYIRMLSSEEASNVISGRSGSRKKSSNQQQNQPFGVNIQIPTKGGNQSKANRARTTEENFAIPSLDAFDELLTDGFTMLDQNKLLTRREDAQSPRKGDRVQVSYIAYVWDCQKQRLIEFASSDLPGRTEPEASPLVFVVGNGETIKGIDEAVQNLEQGQKSRVIVRPDFAYGEVGNPPSVPPNCHLVYDITLDLISGVELPGPPQSQTTNVVVNRPRRQPQQGRGEVNYTFTNGETKKYSLQKMREIVRTQGFKDYGVSPDFVEDHLEPSAFQEAFNMSREDFMLMQKWKRSKLKQDAGL